MTKYFFSILEIGYCSHMMYRAKYMLVSLHLCTLPFSPTFPFPVGNKWPFCNRILLSWVLIICALGWYFFCKLKNHGDLHKTITNSYNMDIFCFVFLLGENYLSISYRIHLEVLWSALSEEVQAEELVSLRVCIRWNVMCRSADFYLDWSWEFMLRWNFSSLGLERCEQKPPAALWECTTNMKQLLDLSIISLTYKTAIRQLNSTEQAW